MKKFTFLIFCLSMAWLSSFAQLGEIKGIVIDGQGNPLIGASVAVVGSNSGTSTKEDGSFIISIPNANEATLRFSFVGYLSRDIKINSNKFLNVTLEQEAFGLNEVVAVGYGTQKKIDLTGSVATVSGEELSKRPVMRASSALEGLVAGLTVTQNSGQPGSDGGTMRIRGIGTLGNSDPLVLVDGIEGNIDGVDPNDIESISVLKDAASASIYGSRAANGVILITTKKGKLDKIKVNYDSYFGWQRFTDLPEFADGLTYLKAFKQAYINEGRTPLFDDDYIAEYEANYLTAPDHYPNVDWQKEAYTGSGFMQHHYLSVTGGSEKFRIMGSMGYEDQKGVIPHHRSTRYSFRINSELDVLDNLQLKFLVSGRHSPIYSPNMDGFDNAYIQINRIPPIYPAVLSDGRYGVAWNGQNPIADVRSGGVNRTDYESFRGTFQANYQPFKGAEIELNMTPTFDDTWAKKFAKTVDTFNPDSESPAYTVPKKSSLSESDSRTWQNTGHLVFRYNRSFNKHNVGLMVGYEQISYVNRNFNAFRDDFPLQDFQELNAGSIDNWQNGGTASKWGLRSYFGRLDYDFSSKYLFQANLRRDGSSRFADGNRFGTFPSFSVGWILSNEEFMKDLTWLANLKIRASWGKLGNQQIGTYPFASTVALGVNYVFGGSPANGAAQKDMANSFISWENTRTTDLGIDLGFVENKFNLSFDVYNRRTSDILLNLPVPGIIGLNSPVQNAGIVENIGWDLSLGYRDQSHLFKYNFGFNLSDVKNKVLDLKGGGPFISDHSIVKEGFPIDELYGYKAIGYFQDQNEVDESPTQIGVYAPGDIKYQDINGDDVINASDKTEIGNQIPRFTFGFNFSAQYKNFDLSLFVQGVGKRKVILYNNAVFAFYNSGKIQTWQLDSWSPDNRNAKYPRLIAETNHNNFERSSFWVFDASYLRFKNLQVGYTLPKILVANNFIDNVRIYISGDNFLTWDHMPKGWDPERASGNAGLYPVSRTLLFGLNLTF